MTGRDLVAAKFASPTVWERAVRAAMRKAEGNRTRAAKILGIPLRTLRRWLGEKAFRDVPPGVPGSPAGYAKVASKPTTP